MLKIFFLTWLAGVLGGRPVVTKSVFKLQLPTGNSKAVLKDCGACSISVSSTSIKSGDWVQVSLNNVSWGTYYDWVGVFAPGDIDPSGAILKYPVRYQYARTSCVPATTEESAKPNVTCVGNACCHTNDYLTSGNAVLGFQLVNLRMDYVFVLVMGPAQFPSVMLQSVPVKFPAFNEPTGAHLALSANPNEVMVLWKSAASNASVFAKWGVSPSSLKNSVTPLFSTYKAASLCGPPAQTLGFRDPGLIYTARFSNLLPNTRYYYELGSEGETFSSSFMSPPQPGDHVIFNAFGDMGKEMTAWDGSLEFSMDNDDRGELGSFNTSRMVAEEIKNSNVSMVLHIGDLSYAVGYAPEWDEFLTQIQPVASIIPWMTSPGNHEWNCPCFISPTPIPADFTWLKGDDSGGECGIPYQFNFQMPITTQGEPWYSFVYGDVFIVMMSTEHDFSSNSTQLLWVEKQLATVNRSVTPFVILTGHRPMYASSPWPADETVPLQKYLQPLLLKYEVDLALWGHHHSYQRTCPVTATGTCQTKALEPAVPHVVIGLGGYEAADMLHTPPPWLLFSENNEFGFSRIRTNATHLHFVFLRSSDGLVIDYLDIAKR